jgi:hypothetical protein
MDPLPGGAQGGTPSAAEIAEALSLRGRYVIRMDPLPHQRLVDVHWTAHRAGRSLGIKVRVVVEGPIREVDPLVTITVRPGRLDRVPAGVR